MSTQADQRVLPTSELDLNMMLTNSVWGRGDVPESLKTTLTKKFLSQDGEGNVLRNPDGTPKITQQSLWGLLGFYTRDMRLANLSEWNNELALCRYMIELAHDYLSENMIEPFVVALSRAVTIMETSQSKGGFLRKNMNTLRNEHTNRNLEPPKKGFFGKTKQDREAMY